ncbi:MAG: ATP-binding protein [Frankiaceae bacterium]
MPSCFRRCARLGNGSAALVHGEAGIGKTSLVRAFLHEVEGHARLLVGACDDLRTPRPLGPFRDASADGAGALAQALRDGDRDAIYSAVTRELSERTPTVLVVEDVHWADDATLGAALLGAAARPAARTGDPHLPRR